MNEKPWEKHAVTEPETPTRDANSQQLGLVQALSREIASAISAIERNDMAELRSRIARQEVICNDLSQQDRERLQKSFESYSSVAQLPTKSALPDKIREAYLTLSRLNRVYAGVIRRSHRSIELILSLYQNHGRRYGQDGNAEPTKRTLSCEV